ncbi:MAG: U32 family peptidase [Erysipelotrichaceae bacterium]|nr:U32 family peptidase [Erysipelotrichaceae bacterium]
MKLVISLNNKSRLYDYHDMGIRYYIIGTSYSLYTPHILSIDDIKEMILSYPDCYFYVNLNALYDQNEINDIELYIDSLSYIGVSGLLFQDFGILQIVKEKGYDFDMMYAPETLNTNAQSINTLSNLGITSAFLSHVIPLEEQVNIKHHTTIPLMMFGHGVEYMAASKRKLITNYKEASQKAFDDDHLMIQDRSSKKKMYIFENNRNTLIFTEERLYTLDLLNQIHDMDYLYIETLFMDDNEAIEVASIYSDALSSTNYNRDVSDLRALLYQMYKPLGRGFLFDNTVYKLEDVRKIDNEKRESNH